MRHNAASDHQPIAFMRRSDMQLGVDFGPARCSLRQAHHTPDESWYASFGEIQKETGNRNTNLSLAEVRSRGCDRQVGSSHPPLGTVTDLPT